MANIQYKCPRCGGALEFDGYGNKVKCPYCDNEYPVGIFEELDKELSETAENKISFDTSGESYSESELAGMAAFRCGSCGAEVVTEETASAVNCPYCGNPTVLMGNLKGDLKPERIVPFRLKKADAMAGFKAHMKGKRFLPREFANAHHLEEIKGMYVPFWLYDSSSDASIKYHATKVHSYSEGKTDVTETEHYSVFRAGELRFENVPVDGSRKLNSTMMESLEPYDFKEAVPFKTAYLAGFYADKYDITGEECAERAGQRMTKSTAEEFAKTVGGYDSVSTEEVNIDVRNGKARYVLLPVWILTTKWNNAIYTFAMNGQTGRFVGDLPCDEAARKRFFWINFLVIFLITALIQIVYWVNN